MDIKTLQTLDEVLHYGSLGEVVVLGHEDWNHLGRLVLDNAESNYEAGMEYVRVTASDTMCNDTAYDCGLDDGFAEGKLVGYQDCIDEHGLEE